MNAESVKARLKNVAMETGRTFQDLLGSYGMERTLYRLSISDYREKFTLKGGIFLYALYDGDYPRATTDARRRGRYNEILAYWRKINDR